MKTYGQTKISVLWNLLGNKMGRAIDTYCNLDYLQGIMLDLTYDF